MFYDMVLDLGNGYNVNGHS